jgi:integrase
MPARKHREGAVSYFKKGLYWHAYWTDPMTGVRGQRSLKCTTQRKAIEEAKKINAALEDDTTHKLDMARESRGITFKDAVQSYIELEGPRHAESSFRQIKNRLLRMCAEHGRKPLHSTWESVPMQSIDDTMIDNWIKAERGKSKWSDNTCRLVLNDITQVLEHAFLQNWVVRNKSRDVKKVKVRDEQIPEILADDVVKPLFDALPVHVRIVMGILLDTGLRLSELFRLVWADVDTKGKTLTVRNRANRTKSGNFRLVPLTSSAAAIFDDLRSGSEWNLVETPNRIRSGMSKLTTNQRAELLATIKELKCNCFTVDNRLQGERGGQKKYCDICEGLFDQYDITYQHGRKIWKDRDRKPRTITWLPDDKPLNHVIPKFNPYKSLDNAAALVGVERFRPHQMRHTWASRLIKTMSAYELMEIGGWSDIEMVKRYARLDNCTLITKVENTLEDLPGLRVNHKPDLRVA